MITSRVYLGLPATPVELLTNGDFELQTGDDFDDWTESAAPAELVTDGGLEILTGDDDWTNWTEYTVAGGSVEQEDTVIHGGTYSAKITGKAQIYQTHAATIGKTYKMGAWVKGDWGLQLSEGVYPHYTLTNGTAADWEYHEVIRTQTTTTTIYFVAVASEVGDVMYVDDITATEYQYILDTSSSYTGDHAVELQGVATILQEVVSDPLDYHRFSFWSKGNGTKGVAYQIYDVTNSAVIKSGYGTINATYTQTVDQYYVPAGCVLLRVTFTGNSDAIVYLDDASVLEYGPDVWTENTDVLAVPAPQWGYGLPGGDPLRLVANTGTADFTLDNRNGYYSPENAARIAGFEEGMDIKITVAMDWEVEVGDAGLLNGSFEADA